MIACVLSLRVCLARVNVALAGQMRMADGVLVECRAVAANVPEVIEFRVIRSFGHHI